MTKRGKENVVKYKFIYVLQLHWTLGFFREKKLKEFKKLFFFGAKKYDTNDDSDTVKGSVCEKRILTINFFLAFALNLV